MKVSGGRSAWIVGLSFLIAMTLSPSANASPSSVLAYFTATDGIHGRELWKSDGTDAGTSMVKDIRPGSKGSDPALFAVIDGRVFFSANDGSHGTRMWVSDGTEAGTSQVAGPFGPPPAPQTWSGGGSAVAAGSLYYTTRQRGHLWVTDGTTSGTHAIPARGDCLAEAGGVVFFSARGQTEIWRTDGTDAGTFMLQRLHRYPSPEFICPGFTDVDGRMFYLGRDVRHGHELWTSDGTVAGTMIVADIKPGRKGSYPSIVGQAAGQVLFQTAYPSFLWASDGTGVGTTRLHRFVYADHLSQIEGDPRLDGASFFYTAPQGAAYELWKSDGTPRGTVVVGEIPPGDPSIPPLGAAPLGNVLLFNADDAVHGNELWRTDGTSAGTMLLRDIDPGTDASFPDHLVDSGGLVFFSATDGVSGTALWRSDGTPSGTVMVRDISPSDVGTNLAITFLCASPNSTSCHYLR